MPTGGLWFVPYVGLAIVNEVILQDAVKAIDATGNGDLVGAGVGVALTAAKPLKLWDKVSDFAKKFSLDTAPCRLSCFVAGTLILTNDGFVPIETLQAGDIVLAHDPDTGETALKPIVRTYVNPNDSIWELELEKEGETYLHEVTASHPYYVIGQGWVEVGNLQQGQLIETEDGKPATVTSLKDTGVVTTTYNFEVQDIHTYYVSAAKVLVHNCGGTPNGRSGALNAAKRDADVPRSQHPDSVSRVPLTDRNGKTILGDDGKPIMTREYTYTSADGSKVVVQDHSAGHSFGQKGVGDQGSHFNVRPPENTRTGSVPGTQDHYNW